ncbi:hypothetical protein RI367_006057 [Sorochytrium milnesiophthora]
MTALEHLQSPATLAAAAAIVLHVANYNATAQVEHATRIFTKLIGRHAVYFYAVYLIASALVRDHFIDQATAFDTDSLVLLPPVVARWLGGALMAFGMGLNLWTLKALGIKGMYNGDSFGFLMDSLVTGGPYVYFNDPQYVGTAVACVGHAMMRQSAVGYLLAMWMWLVFQFSVRFVEGPHMKRIYSAKSKGSSKSKSKKTM